MVEIIFIQLFGLLLSTYVQVFLDLLVICGRILFQAAMVGCFLKEKTLYKQLRVLSFHLKKN